jgi:hypothetical protein
MNDIGNADRMPPGPQLNALVAETVLGMRRGRCYGTFGGGSMSAGGSSYWFRCRWCGQRIENGLAGPCPRYPFPRFSEDVGEAWKLDRSYLRWEFGETEGGLEIRVQPTEEIWREFYADVWPTYEGSGISASVGWGEVEDKATAYALGRCRAILKVLGVCVDCARESVGCVQENEITAGCPDGGGIW